MSKATNDKENETKRNMRRYFSHIMNGADLLYKGIEDNRISISVYVQTFVFFKSNILYNTAICSVAISLEKR
ncbi:hypothetical protein CHS0354_003885 [Potamilus streckersoni]|uniref:Uncharacterized protein n=1 Tax=Potamilus streckersoni TaxID=2493646 RepID=A0AAE0VQF9_9BIVA|nr:hypothetical protein CHS0354_003885 [Potamilus streckersoni]